MNRHKLRIAIKALKASKGIQHRENVDFLIAEVIKTLRDIQIELDAKEYSDRAEAHFAKDW